MTAEQNTFDILLIIARPAAGKSEIIDYLKKTDRSERVARFHINTFEEIDDFPMLWTWFEEDQILQDMGYDRLHTDENGFFTGQHLWNLLIRRICQEYKKKLRDQPDYHEEYTTIIEFARGSEHGGFKTAFKHLSKDVVEKMAILYINVSWEESLRKNRLRFNPEKPDSILEHGLPDTKLKKMYRYSDWDDIPKEENAYIIIQEKHVPYVVFENEDDVTTGRGSALGERLQDALERLWALYMSRP